MVDGRRFYVNPGRNSGTWCSGAASSPRSPPSSTSVARSPATMACRRVPPSDQQLRIHGREDKRFQSLRSPMLVKMDLANQTFSMGEGVVRDHGFIVVGEVGEEREDEGVGPPATTGRSPLAVIEATATASREWKEDGRSASASGRTASRRRRR